VPNDLPLLVLDLLVGVTLAVCGVIAWRRRPSSRVGVIMILASACWFAGYLMAAAAFLHRGPLVHLHISYPTGRLRAPLARLAVIAAYVVAIVELFIDGAWLTLGVALLVAVAAFDIFVRSAGPSRKATQPALFAALAFAGVLALSSANALLNWDLDLPILLVYDVVVAALVILLLVDLLRGRWTEATIADLVTKLGEPTDDQRLRGELRRALGDPSLELGLWIPDQARYVDEAGRPVELPGPSANRAVTQVEDDGEPLGFLVHDVTALDDPRLIARVTSAARISIANARMNAEVRARMVELAESRRRLVESTDEQRREIEAELTRGPQRRLEDVARILGECPPTKETGQLLTELAMARVELSEFAQGIRPSALDAGGLAAAIPLLAQRSVTPVELALDVDRLDPAVESALYFFCSEALANIAKHAQAQRVSLTVASEGNLVMATVTDDGLGGANPNGLGLRGLADRIEALGGTMSVAEAPGGGTVLAAQMPIIVEQLREAR